MKILISGSREFNDYALAKEFIDGCLADLIKDEVFTVLSGGCRGADSLGERYAAEKGYTVWKYPADWKRYGRAAGPIRNEIMVKTADVIICFPKKESRGSRSVIALAEKYNKKSILNTYSRRESNSYALR